MDVENLSDFFEHDIFSVLEAWENASSNNKNNKNVISDELSFEFHKSSSDQTATTPPSSKRQKVADSRVEAAEESGQPRTSHIKVERNRRKQMNENLSVLRSLMPCFYVKRGDQASVIGGVVDYITELQHLIQSLQAQKQRKSGPDIMSPRPSPRKPPLSPRLSPRTPQSVSPYKHILQPSVESIISPCSSSVNDAINELVASMKSEVAEVEVKFTGPNLVLKTVSRRGAGPGQAVRIVSALEELDLEILHVKINVVDERVLNLFTIKIGIECGVSAQELAQQIHHTFGLPNTHPEFGNANLT